MTDERQVGLREALDDVMRNVVIGTWYDDPANERGQAAVNRLHDAEAAMWRLYGFLGLDPGDAYTSRAALAVAQVPEEEERLRNLLAEVGRVAVGVANDWMGDPDHGFILDSLVAPIEAWRRALGVESLQHTTKEHDHA